MFYAFLGKALYLKRVIHLIVLILALCALVYLVKENPVMKNSDDKLVEHYAMCVDGAQYVIYAGKVIILKKQDGVNVACPKANMQTVYRIYIDESLYMF